MIIQINDQIDNVWMMIVVIEVCCMQLGFVLLEVGTIRSKNSRNIIYKNMVDTFVSTITFWIIGYGQSQGGAGGFLGSGGFFDSGFGNIEYQRWI